MANISPIGLISSARLLLDRAPDDAFYETSIRRAISNCYYGVFHTALGAAAGELFTDPTDADLYSLVYRSVNHLQFKGLCIEVARDKPSAKFEKYHPEHGFSQNLKRFANASIDLYEKRISADYDPTVSFSALDGSVALKTAVSGLNAFHQASGAGKKTFLTLLLFPPR